MECPSTRLRRSRSSDHSLSRPWAGWQYTTSEKTRKNVELYVVAGADGRSRCSRTSSSAAATRASRRSPSSPTCAGAPARYRSVRVTYNYVRRSREFTSPVSFPGRNNFGSWRLRGSQCCMCSNKKPGRVSVGKPITALALFGRLRGLPHARASSRPHLVSSAHRFFSASRLALNLSTFTVNSNVWLIFVYCCLSGFRVSFGNDGAVPSPKCFL